MINIRTFIHYRLLFSTWILLGSGLFSPSLAHAQASYSLSVSPPSAFLKIKPGSTASHTIELTNHTDQPIIVTPKVFDSRPAENTGFPEFQTTFSFPYLSNQPEQNSSIAIKPGETSNYTLDFTVPLEAMTKEYPLTVLFSATTEQQNATNLTTSQSKLYGVVGANIVVLISGDSTLPNLLSVTEIEHSNIQDSLRELSFTPILLNQGVQAVVASGSATITNMFGQTVWRSDLYPDLLLAKQQRKARALSSNNDDQLPKPALFTYDPLFLLGRYQLMINVNDNQGNIISTETKTVIALPYSIMIVLCAMVATWIVSKQLVKRSSPE